MEIKPTEFYTNQRLRNKFRNNFDLANYGIEIARSYMREGQPHSLKQLVNELAQLSDIQEENKMLLDIAKKEDLNA